MGFFKNIGVDIHLTDWRGIEKSSYCEPHSITINGNKVLFIPICVSEFKNKLSCNECAFNKYCNEKCSFENGDAYLTWSGPDCITGDNTIYVSPGLYDDLVKEYGDKLLRPWSGTLSKS